MHFLRHAPFSRFFVLGLSVQALTRSNASPSLRAKRKIFLVLPVLLLFAAPSGRAQVTTGTPPFGSFSGSADIINNANLNAHWVIPVVNKPGRGLAFAYNLVYDSWIWVPVTNSGTTSWGFNTATHLGWTTSMPRGGNVSYTETGPTQHRCAAGGLLDLYLFSQWRYVDGLGTPHAFSGTSAIYANCPNMPPTSFTSTASDGSGYTLSVTGNRINSLVASDGTIINPAAGAITLQDRNGNQITSSTTSGTTSYYDTLSGSTPVLTVSGSGTPTSPNTFTYTAPSGSSTSYTMKYAAYTVQTKFGCANIAEYGPASVNLVSEIDLPDGTKYSYTYEPTPGVPGSVTGRAASVTLPTGGTISYSYSGGGTGVNGISCSDGSAATVTRTTPDGTWTYAQVKGTGAASTTTITNPLQNQTVIQFQGIYETQRQVYQGSTTSGTLLDTVYTCYNGAAYPCAGTAITLPISQITKTNSLASGQTSQTVTSYNTYGLPTEIDEYGYGSGSPGSLARKTTTTYASLGNNINSRPAVVSIYAGGASSPTSQTTYTYDQWAVAATSGTPQHVAVSGSRGNTTTTTRLVAGSSTISTTATYFDTGTVQTAYDSKSNWITYSYGTSSCGNSFATLNSMPLNLSRSLVWNCNAGLVATLTDENGRVTSYSYDWMNRLTQANSPDGGWDLMNDTSATQQDTYTGITDTTPSSGCTGCQHLQRNLDTSGREGSKILVNDPEGQTTTAAVYDSLGRLQKTSNPYRSTSDPTYGFDTTAYDAFNRVTTVTHADNNVSTNYYGSDVASHGGASSQLCASGTYGLGYPVLTVDEAAMKHQIWVDALRRTIEADEPDSSGNLTVATCYGHDTLNNLTGVVQGTQTRTYSYDGLSRKTAETTPEGGATNYYYTTAAGALCSGNPLDVCRRTDARIITTTYSYDALNRLTSQTYSDSTPAANYYYDESSVTVSGTTYTLSNTKGRLSHTSGAGGTAITIHSYDSMGRAQDLWQCTPYNCSSASIWKTHYAYDLAGDLTSWQHPNGETITHTISNARRITQITSSLSDATHPGTLAQNIKYAPHGAVSQLQNGCVGTGCTAIQETYDYNDRLQSSRIQIGTSANPSADSCLVYNYYSGVGNATSCVIPAQGSTGDDHDVLGHYFQDTANSSLSHTATFTYDSTNRLATSVATGSSTQNLTFSYDRYGNMSCTTNGQTNGPCPNYTFNTAKNQISNTGYSYDAAGNVTADGTGTGSHTYQWDAENRLKSIDGGSTATYTYNALGQRVEKLAGSSYTEYVYQASGEILGEHNRSSWLVRVIAFAGRHLAHYQGTPEATYFVHSDKLGSTSQVSDYQGAIVQDQLYYPWGQEWSVMGTTQEKRFAQLGHRDVTDTGLDPTPFRMFSSSQGRWLSIDPSQGASRNPQILNRYAYATNNPTTRIDPLGSQECDPEFGCGCPPYDPFCGFIFLDVIRINFDCPSNKCSCCPYYELLIKRGPTFVDRNYGRLALLVCENTGTDCIQNCIRQCLVNYNMQHCDRLPSPYGRLYCREIKGHAFCIPPCVLVGGFMDNGITIIFPAPVPIFIDITITVPFACNLTA